MYAPWKYSASARSQSIRRTLACKEKRANVWCAKVFMGAGLLYNITLLDTDKKTHAIVLGLTN